LKLAEIGNANGLPAFRLCARKRRNQQRGEDGDDRHDDEEFDQREGHLTYRLCSARSVSARFFEIETSLHADIISINCSDLSNSRSWFRPYNETCVVAAAARGQCFGIFGRCGKKMRFVQCGWRPLALKVKAAFRAALQIF
jgi:hypothetical protein